MMRGILLWWLRRQDCPREFTFPGALIRARRVLVFMPSKMEPFRQAEYFLSRMPRVFERAKVTLLYPPKSLAATFYNPYGFEVVVPAAGEVGIFGWPGKKLLRRLFVRPFDLIITLDKEPNLFFAAVMMKSQTAARIGLPGGLGMPFTSVEFRPARATDDPKTEFILFIEMMRKLVTPPTVEETSGGAGVPQTP